MGKTAYLFPGQGSQYVEMGLDLAEKYPAARTVFERADKALGFSLSGICFEGPEETLKETMYAQPALLTMSMACLASAREALGEKLPEADYMAGHSLGEYSALAAAEALEFEEAVCLAYQRGRLMKEAGKQNPGTMAAVLALPDEIVEEICRENGVWTANFNCPGQVAISGREKDIESASEAAKKCGAKRVIPLSVSGAFHSPLMEPAQKGLAEALAKAEFRNPRIPIIGNTRAQKIERADEIQTELEEQLTSSVRWTQTVQYLIEQGVTRFIEIGAGDVLSGLVRRIDKNVETICIGMEEDIEDVMESL